MSAPVQSPNSYLDFAGLGRLRGQAHADSASALRETGQQFEAMFIQMMLKSMREAVPKSGLMQSGAMDSYQELYDKELSTHLAKRGMLGIADMLAKQLAQPQAAPLDPENLSKPQGMAETAALPSLPLNKPRQAVPLHKAAPMFTLTSPTEGGLPLSRLPALAPTEATVQTP